MDDPPERHTLVKLIEEAGWDDNGPVVSRTYLADASLWKQFIELWDPILQCTMDAAPDSAGFECIGDRLQVRIVDDEALGNKCPDDVAFAHRLCEDDDDSEEVGFLEPGLRTRMCLFVDQECMESVTAPRADALLFVKAVSVRLGTTRWPEQAFVSKVAIESLITEVYPALLLPEISVTELRPIMDGDA
ncbi:hypothetical protein AUEXF2481DRAFT_652933 [Aureobasidium subglaciale EXF-2481]|uniref:Uncharacterized protein n=1 Tax=Aureobasidium subglaciale (strain EXF-2481) TaxID=1043005 RepID=A0A074YPA4_AURSE|nr:uncharacterized protein AUEXF2481DRAFT_652933 [Aureobasidium subglaciale EXF-2481]KAI5211073.1 hypothetical protein E4T38_01538 [Aureobasidium subglaciale]KAI5219084.1 hypothetical protein E4T40_06610 [Aureobasidium subglaciale]KAI5233203.1 hypothetical protein E4T41_01536 [Aureobasidium subglaciale]KAI5260031.1 hypothetical protein E4T46_06410 [Aureobasidium subglaciale]KEQ95917.1 hypothetical protein AUEXF2481DRAFT_652933 [Aureobasidium subglaciale EXF-2481]